MKYVCELCGKVYDESQGDPRRGIAAGTAFSQLPEQYTCPDCGSEKEAFCAAGGEKPVLRKASGSYIKYAENLGESQR